MTDRSDMTNGKAKLPAGELQELLDLSADYGEAVATAVQAALDEPLDTTRATRLYTRVLHLLRGSGGGGLSAADRARIAEEVRAEVATIVASVPRPTTRGTLKFVEWNGLEERPVLPVPTFNDKPIPMQEGYVLVDDLKLWAGNHRLELHVAEFRERNNREPSDDELVKLMQGAIHLPSLGKTDPFKLSPLAESIARKGVERPPIVTHDGVPKDGNRRIAASLLVLHGKDFTDEQKERARHIRVWRAPMGTTDDQFDAVVVALNFESDHKEEWAEYIKARLVVEQYDARREALRGRVTTADIKRIKTDVAKRFGIKLPRVTRYIEMVRWAEDFEAFHVTGGRDPAEVRYKTDEHFQWFYEIDAGKGEEKLTRKLDTDDQLKKIVYEMMFDLLDSGAQVRNLHQVIADADAAQMLTKAYEMMHSAPEDALELVDESIALAKRKSVKRRSVGFDQFLKTMVDRFGATPPDQWNHVDSQLLLDVKRVFQAQLGAIEGQIAMRASGEPVE